MTNALKTSSLSLGSNAFTKSSALFSKELEPSLQKSVKLQASSSQPLQTNSSRNIGTFDRVFSTSGSVRRNDPDVFRFEIAQRSRIRLYLSNRLSDSRSNDRRMFADILSDRTLRTIRGLNIAPGRINTTDLTLNPSIYRVRVSTRSNTTGRYVLDMIRV